MICDAEIHFPGFLTKLHHWLKVGEHIEEKKFWGPTFNGQVQKEEAGRKEFLCVYVGWKSF